MALNCNKEIPGVTDYEGTVGVPAGQCYPLPHGTLPVGITTQDPELRKRLDVDEAAGRVFNFLHALTLEVQMLARACGKTSVHSLEPEDLAALTVEASAMARVPLRARTTSPAPLRSGRSARSATLLDQYSRTRWTTSGRGPEPRRRRTASDERGRRTGARKGRLDRRGVSLRQALSLPGGHFADRGHRPGGRDSGKGPELLEDVELLEEEGTPRGGDSAPCGISPHCPRIGK